MLVPLGPRDDRWRGIAGKPSVAGPGAIWGGLGGNDAAAPKRDDGPALSLPSLPKLPSLPSFPVAPDAPAKADAPGLSLPKLSAPSLPSLPGVPGLPALPALPQVEINPIANIAVERPSVPEDAAPIEYADLVKKARLGGVTKVEFLSANGDVAVATLSDGSLRSIKVVDDKSGSYKLAAKMRDYGVPYAYSFNLGKFNEAAKRTSMRSKNQNVLDAEARQRDEDARLAALDARLAAEHADHGLVDGLLRDAAHGRLEVGGFTGSRQAQPPDDVRLELAVRAARVDERPNPDKVCFVRVAHVDPRVGHAVQRVYGAAFAV